MNVCDWDILVGNDERNDERIVLHCLTRKEFTHKNGNEPANVGLMRAPNI